LLHVADVVTSYAAALPRYYVNLDRVRQGIIDNDAEIPNSALDSSVAS